jgi:hypothetical protein
MTKDPPDMGMDDGMDMDDQVMDDAGASPRAAEKDFLDAAQGMLDLAAVVRMASETTGHVKGKKYMLKMIGDLESMAARTQAMAEKIKAELDSVGSNDETEEVEADTEVEDSEDDEMDIETDEEGALMSKSFKGFKPKRFVQKGRVTLAELKQPAGLKADEVPIKKSRLKELVDLERVVQADLKRRK